MALKDHARQILREHRVRLEFLEDPDPLVLLALQGVLALPLVLEVLVLLDVRLALQVLLDLVNLSLLSLPEVPAVPSCQADPTQIQGHVEFRRANCCEEGSG